MVSTTVLARTNGEQGKPPDEWRTNDIRPSRRHGRDGKTEAATLNPHVRGAFPNFAATKRPIMTRRSGSISASVPRHLEGRDLARSAETRIPQRLRLEDVERAVLDQFPIPVLAPRRLTGS